MRYDWKDERRGWKDETLHCHSSMQSLSAVCMEIIGRSGFAI